MPWLLSSALLCADLAPEFRKPYEYSRNAKEKPQEKSVQRRPGATVFDFSYESPKGGSVPGTLVVPRGNGRFPVILYGHWMMPGSPLRNRGEFLEEAIVMANSGAMCLMIDSPLVRGKITEDADPMNGQSAYAQAQMVVDFRKGLDLLLERHDTDSKRVAYVGHSFDAAVGAKLTALEKRIGWFVLMAGNYADEEYVFDADLPSVMEIRKKEGADRIRSYFRKYPWDDPVHFIGHSGPSAVFLQYGRYDKPLPERIARSQFMMFGQPKRIEFYDAGHELNSAARLDRAQWLAAKLKLKPVDEAALNRIVPLK